MSRYAAGTLLCAPEPSETTVPANGYRLVIRRVRDGAIYEWHARCEQCNAFGRRFTLASHRQPGAFEMARRHALLSHGVTL